jgi:leader peptidase (prepilin peptidase)/N-methyltransferase
MNDFLLDGTFFGNPWVIPLLLFVFGCCIGSFLNVCIYRLPLDRSIVAPRSSCPKCQTPIRALDNIPLLSYVWLRGRCRKCKASISWRYPLVEASTGALAVALFFSFGLSVQSLMYFSLAAALIVITFIDLDHRIIPDVISLPGIGLGILLAALLPGMNLQDSLIGLLLGGGSLYLVARVYEAFTRREGMGMGDVKLLAMIGAWLGWQSVLFIIFFSSLTGTMIGGLAMLFYGKGRHYAIPFGPFLALSALAYIFVGPDLIRWYLALREI